MRLHRTIRVHPGEKISPPRTTRRGKRMALAAGWTALTLAGVAPCAHAAVSFSNVADTTTTAPGHGPFTGFATAPSISGSNVGFVGYYDDPNGAGLGLYTGSVGATGAAKIVDRDDNAPGGDRYTFITDPSLSGNTIAFAAGYSGSGFGSGIYTGTVGTAGAAKIVDTTDAPPGNSAFKYFTSLGGPAVSGSTVGFFGSYNSFSSHGIFTGSVGATGATTVVQTGDTAPGHGPFTTFGTFVSLGGNSLAFVGNYDGSGQGIFTGSVGATGAAKIVDNGDTAPGHGPFTFFGDYTAVSGSNVAFLGNYTGGQGIYTGTVGVAGAAKVVDTSDGAPGHGAFTGFGNVGGYFSLSGSDVAFLGAYSGGHGIYLASGGAGGTLSPIINTGDTLFGGTVNYLSMGSFALDNNAIAFEYALSDGRGGIAVASIPEPASLSLLALSAAALLRRRR